MGQTFLYCQGNDSDRADEMSAPRKHTVAGVHISAGENAEQIDDLPHGSFVGQGQLEVGLAGGVVAGDQAGRQPPPALCDPACAEWFG